jgi:hypothetical protein
MIGCDLQSDMKNLDEAWIDLKMREKLSRPSLNLGELTLLRGRELGLASAENLRDAIEAADNRRQVEFVGHHDMYLTVADAKAKGVAGWQSDLRDRTPLWYYVLREAEVLGCGGRHLGPLGSRIVMETLDAAIRSAAGSVLEGKCFKPLAESLEPGYTHPTLASIIAAGVRN